MRSIYQEAGAEDDDDLRKALSKHARSSEARNRIDNMLELGKSEPGIPITVDELDDDPWAFNCTNGALDLQTGQLREHRREDLITKLAPVAYDPTAECPQFLAFLEQIMDGNQDLIRFLQRAIGYSLTGLTREQVLFLLYGLGANGKSTLLEALAMLLGDYAQQADFATFLVRRNEGPRNDIARLRGARFVSATEAESGARMSEVLVKQLTGGDTVTARFLHQEFFDFKPEFKLWLAANHKPVIRGTDNAMWRRIKLIPFAVTIPESEQDKNLPAKLQAELSGILAWAVRGCLEWQEHGLGEPEAVKAATGEYREEMDVLGDFLAECCILELGATAKATELYRNYKSWCEQNGIRELSQRVFGSGLTERGVERQRKTDGWYRLGIGLLAQNMTLEAKMTHLDPSGGVIDHNSSHIGFNPNKGSSRVKGHTDWEEGSI